MGIGVWNRLELIEICIIPNVVDLYIPCASSFNTSSRHPECETSRTNGDETHLLRTRRLSQRGQREIKAVVLNDIRCEREWVLYTSPDSSFSTRSEWPRNPRGPSLPKWSSSTTISHTKGEKRTQANTSHLDACRSISAPSSRLNNSLDADANKGGDLRAGNSAMQEKALEDATSNVT